MDFYDSDSDSSNNSDLDLYLRDKPLKSEVGDEASVLNRNLEDWGEVAQDIYEDIGKPLDRKSLKFKLALLHKRINKKVRRYGPGRVRNYKFELPHVEYLKTTFGHGVMKYQIRQPKEVTYQPSPKNPEVIKMVFGRGLEHIISHTFALPEDLPVIFPPDFAVERHVPNCTRSYNESKGEGVKLQTIFRSEEDMKELKQERKVDIAREKAVAAKGGSKFIPLCPPEKPVCLSYNWERMEISLSFDFLKMNTEGKVLQN